MIRPVLIDTKQPDKYRRVETANGWYIAAQDGIPQVTPELLVRLHKEGLITLCEVEGFAKSSGIGCRYFLKEMV